MNNLPGWLKPFLIISSLALFLISCFLPSLFLVGSNGVEEIKGYYVLAIGWMGILIGQVGWYANFFYFLSLGALLVSRSLTSLWAGILATGLALNSFLLKKQEIPGDEGGTFAFTFESFGPGFILWLTAIIFAFLASLLGKVNESKKS